MENNQKQRIVEKIKKATNILVTVSSNPSVDELSAALAFTLMLNKMDKHGTAVFSGATPPAITFLEPHKTFEQNTNSLRDFIVALDKEKADRLRYKVEDDVVRIYITPYRTTITEQDLQFSQGDFNVELIVALGVKDKADLDQAISAHGRILHDATILTINTEEGKGNLGSIEWNDKKASSLCEMLMNLTESLQSDILDEQISTALLTGIVAATDRFSNQKTSPKVMTMSAQLMAAGANQQLISDELEQAEAINQPAAASAPAEEVPNDGRLREGTSAKIDRAEPAPVDQSPEEDYRSDEPAEAPAVVDDGSLHISHDGEQDNSPQQRAEDALDAALLSAAPPKAPTLSVADLQRDIAAENNLLEQEISGPRDSQAEQARDEEPAQEPPVTPTPVAAPAQSDMKSTRDWRDMPPQEPVYGSPLSATTEEAAESKRLEEARNRNRTLLSHERPGAVSAPSEEPTTPGSQSVNGQTEAEQASATPDGNYDEQHSSAYGHSRGKDIQPVTMQPITSSPANLGLAESTSPFADATSTPASSPERSGMSIADFEKLAQENAEPTFDKSSSLEAARQEISNLFGSADGYEATPMPGQVSTAPVQVPPQFTEPTSPVQPSAASDSSLPPMPPLPPMMPDFSTLPPLPGDSSAPAGPHPGANPFDQPDQPPQAPPSTPGQFQIPGQ